MPKKGRELKPKFSVSIEPGMVKWMDAKIKERRFANRSHAIEVAMDLLMKQEE